jgi:hypothetical protein
MNLDNFIITCFCLIDEMLPAVLGARPLRYCGRRSQLSDSEVITMEIVAAYLGLTQDQAIYDYFRQHYAHFFPALRQQHRTSFVRHAANLWAIKERLWCWLRDERLSYDPSPSIIDSVPMLVCCFARAPWCARVRGIASFGKDYTNRQTFYGFRLHVRLSWPGLITEAFPAPANEADDEIAAVILQDTQGIVLGDRNYWLPDLQAFLLSKGVHLLAPFHLAHSPQAAAYESPVLGRARYRIDTVLGQLTDRCGLKRLWTRDLWHLRNRLLRIILMHTLCVWLNQQDQAPLLQLDRLVA